MKTFYVLTAITTAIVAQVLTAQVPHQGLAMEIVAARQKNAALMKQYSWNSRTELLMNSAVKDIRLEQVVYGADGKLQRTLLNDQPASQPHGFLRRRIAEHEKDDVEKYFKGLAKVIDEYTLPTAGKVLDFIGAATIQAPDANNQLQLTGNGVVVPADTLSLTINGMTKQPTQMKITTFFEGDQVTVTATYKTLTNGLNYVSFAQVDVPAKGWSLQLQNYDYINQNQ